MTYTYTTYFVRPKRVPPEPDDPYEDNWPGIDWRESDRLAPPAGAIESDGPEAVDRHAADQLVLSIAQVYDTAWPLVPEAA